MEIPSADRAHVEVQRAVTQAHQLLLRSPIGPWLDYLPGPHFLVLQTRGRRSGQARRTPLSFTKDGDAFVVIASNGGAPKHPDWYLNLLAHPEAEATVSGATTRVRAETVSGTERAALWQRAMSSYGGYAGYQARTEREIPVVRLAPVRTTTST